MRSQTNTTDRDQHTMLAMVEQMQREGRSEEEIVEALDETAADEASATRRWPRLRRAA
jgi:hypothetical protein